MGGAVASLIAMKPDLFPGLKFVILSGSPDIEQLITLKNLSFFSFPMDKDSESNKKKIDGQIIPVNIKSLHFSGVKDTEVLPEKSQKLASRFFSPLYYDHEQGHCIPTKPNFIAIIMNFLELFILKEDFDPLQVTSSASKIKMNSDVKKDKKECKVKSSTENNTLFKTKSVTRDVIVIDQKIELISNCTSESNAEQQRDEIDAITAIFTDDDIKVSSVIFIFNYAFVAGQNLSL